jgi:malate dehydrogenase
MSRKKIAFFGAGNVGGTAAFLCAIKELGDIILLDTDDRQGIAIGKALDIKQSLSVFYADVSVTGSSNPEEISDADVCVILAGSPRKPGMSRDDLFTTNYRVIESIAESIRTYAPNCIVIMVTNPLDAMTYAMLKLCRFPKNHVLGMAGILDSIRLQSTFAELINCSTKDITTLVLGSHGDEMVPIFDCSSVNGVPITNFLDDLSISESALKTRNYGGEIVKLMGTSAFFAAASSVMVIIESIVKDQKRILPCSVLLEGEYGINDSCTGVPVMIGKDGVEKIIEIPLSKSELFKLQKSAEIVKKVISSRDYY